MAGPYGVTPAGFVLKPLQQILADYQSAWLTNVDPTADLSTTTPEGQILGILAAEDAELWQLAQAGWDAYNREAVEGAGLDNLGDLEGVPREGPSYTQVVCNLSLDPAHAPYAAGSLIANMAGQPAVTFSNLAAVTSGMISGGTAAGILFQATTIGQTPTVNPGTLTAITSPATGWTAITNPDEQTQLGSNVELDDQYAVRQQEEIGADGSCNPSATAAALLELGAEQAPPVTFTVNILENKGETPLTIGTLTLPPHSFAAIVYDPTATVTSAQIAPVIWANKPPGIPSYGTTLAQYTDPILGLQNLFYTAPVSNPLYVDVTVVLKSNFTIDVVGPAIAAALVAAAIAVTPPNGDTPNGQLVPGAPVIGSQLEGVVMTVPGVFDCQALTFGFSPGPTNTAPLIVSPTNVATITGVNVTVQQGTYP